jgi:cell division protein FtsB
MWAYMAAWVVQLPLIEKVLIVVSAMCIVGSAVLGVDLYFTNAQLKAARADAIESQSFLTVQNAQIQELKRQGDAAAAKVSQAQTEASEARRKYDRLSRDIMSRPAPATCEEARIYGLDLAKSLVGEQ